MTKMLTKKLVTEETVLDKQPRHAFYPSNIPNSTAKDQAEPISNNCIQEYKGSDKVDKSAVTITLCTDINPASSLRELRLYYSFGRWRALQALIPLGEYHCEL